jgi:hypothetical protein
LRQRFTGREKMQLTRKSVGSGTSVQAFEGHGSRTCAGSPKRSSR